MGAVKVNTHGQSVTLTAVYDMDRDAATSGYSDVGLSSPLSLPYAVADGGLIYLVNGSKRVTLAVVGGATYSEHVIVQGQQQIVDIPADSIGTIAVIANAIPATGFTGVADLSAATVALPAGTTGLTKATVGLTNATDTSDASKPVSTAQQTALNLKANLASPTLTGTPAAPTAAAATNTTQIATTAHLRTALSNVLPKVVSVDDYGADPTGAVASDTAITNARTALGATGVLRFGAGTYRINASLAVFGPNASVEGAGAGVTTLDFRGSGPCLQVKHASFDVTSGADVPAARGGHITGLTISGANASAGATGIKAGDMLGFVIRDLVIRGFSGAGSVGLTLDSAVGWLEQAELDLLLSNNTTAVLFDEHSAHGSFGYGVYRFTIYAKINQHGMVMQNGAHMWGSDIQIKANFETGVSNTGKAIWMGAAGSGDASYIQGSHVDIQAETGGSTGVGHMTWDMSAAATFGGNGILNFLTGGSVGWSDGTVYRQGNTHFMFSGRINVDANLGVSLYGYGFDAIGSVTGNQGYMDGSAGTIYLGAGNYFAVTLTNSAHTVSFNSSATGKAMTIELFVKQPASGAAGTLTWPGSVKWAAATPPTLTATNGATDRIRLVTADGATWFGELVGKAFA